MIKPSVWIGVQGESRGIENRGSSKNSVTQNDLLPRAPTLKRGHDRVSSKEEYESDQCLVQSFAANF